MTKAISQRWAFDAIIDAANELGYYINSIDARTVALHGPVDKVTITIEADLMLAGPDLLRKILLPRGGQAEEGKT